MENHRLLPMNPQYCLVEEWMIGVVEVTTIIQSEQSEQILRLWNLGFLEEKCLKKLHLSCKLIKSSLLPVIEMQSLNVLKIYIWLL